MRQLKISKQVTNRETASLDRYLSEISKIPLISTDEEVELAQRIKQGDQFALEKLCKANLRFVVSVAKQYQNQGLLLPDLINEGNVGLIKAAQRFDETRGFKFISYAVWWIRQAILQALAEQSRIVRLPLNKIGSINKIKKASEKLEQQFGREPNSAEIAFLLEVSENSIKEVTHNSRKHVSMDALLSEDDKSTRLDILNKANDSQTDRSLVHSESLKIETGRAVATLVEREREVIEFFFGLEGKTPLSLEEIGGKYNLTRGQVQHIKNRAIRRLKYTKNRKILKSYLG